MAQAAFVPSAEDIALPVICRHHWVIQPANGPESQGECQVCGEVKSFKNHVDNGSWGDIRLNPPTGIDKIRDRQRSIMMAEQEDFEEGD